MPIILDAAERKEKVAQMAVDLFEWTDYNQPETENFLDTVSKGSDALLENEIFLKHFRAL